MTTACTTTATVSGSTATAFAVDDTDAGDVVTVVGDDACLVFMVLVTDLFLGEIDHFSTSLDIV